MKAPLTRILALTVLLTLFSFNSLANEAPASPRGTDENLVDDSPRPKVFSIETSPLGFYFRRYNLEGDLGVSHKLALGLKGTTYNNPVSGLFDSVTGYQVGPRVTWSPFSERMTTGIILRGSVYYNHTETHNDIGDAIGNAIVQVFSFGTPTERLSYVDVVRGPEFEFQGGFQFVAPTGFCFNFNGGLTTHSHYKKVLNLDTGATEQVTGTTWAVYPVVEANVGWMF